MRSITKPSKKSAHLHAFVFMAPTIAIVSVFIYFSICFAIFLSFNKVSLLNLRFTFTGLQNYIRLFSDNRLLIAFLNTVKFVLIVAPVQTAIALTLAAVLNSKIRGQLQFRVIYFIPTLTSSTALTMIFMFIFSIDGPFNNILTTMGYLHERINWLNEPAITLKIIMAMNIWSTVPYYVTIYLSALQDIPKSNYEAAKIDGANAFDIFKDIIVPQMKPITTFVLVTSIIGTFQMFDQAYIFSNGSGGPENSTLTLALMVYQYSFGTMNTMGYASAVAIIMSIVIFAASMIASKLNSSESLY